MDSIFLFHKDLQNYSLNDIKILATFFHLPIDESIDNLRWLIALYQSFDKAEMKGMDIIQIKSEFKFTPELRYIPSNELSVLTTTRKERELKFLGRTVFDLVLADYLYRTYQNMDVQSLSNLLLDIRSNNYIYEKIKNICDKYELQKFNCVSKLMTIIGGLYLYLKKMKLDFIKILQNWLFGELKIIYGYNSTTTPLAFNAVETDPNPESNEIIDKLKIQLKFMKQFDNIPDELLLSAITPVNGMVRDKTEYPTNYERLEWLGDRVLELVISDYIYTFKPTFISIKSNIVNNENLIKTIGESCKLIQTRRKIKDKMCADMFEAIIGAIYLNLTAQNNNFIDTLHIWLVVILDIIKEI